MKKNNYSVALFLLLMFLASGTGFGQKVGTTSFQFLKVMPDARSTAMGEASSTITYSSNAVFHNPAGLTAVDGFDGSVSYVDWFMDVYLSAFSAAFRLGNLGTFGVQAIYTSVGDIEVTTVDALGFVGGSYNPGLTGETITPNSLVFGLSYAKALSDKFSFGITAKFAREDLIRKAATSVLFDGGLIYHTGFRSLDIGVMVRQFGPDIKFVEEAFPPPQTFNIGLSAYLISPENSFLMSSESQKLLISVDMMHPRDYDQQYNFGLEYSLKDLVFLRAGYKANYDTEGLTLGGGLKLFRFAVDYSYNDFGDYLDAVHRFTVRFLSQ